MTLNEIAVLLASQLEREFDTPFVLMVKERVKLWRSRLIIQRLESKPLDRTYFTQSTVVDMIRIDDVECSDSGLGEECIMRSKDKIPKLVRTSVLFDYVGAENFRNPYSRITPLILRYLPYERNQVGVKFLWRNEYLYTYRSEAPKMGITGIFQQPETISLCNIKRLGEEECDEEDLEYFCPDDILSQVIQSILATDFRVQVPDLVKEEIKPINQ